MAHFYYYFTDVKLLVWAAWVAVALKCGSSDNIDKLNGNVIIYLIRRVYLYFL
jgi:hypothetical protein